MIKGLERGHKRGTEKWIWFILGKEKAKGKAYHCLHLPNGRVQNKIPLKGTL